MIIVWNKFFGISTKNLCNLHNLFTNLFISFRSPSDMLISPCRCSGTMKWVHTSCLVVSYLYCNQDLQLKWHQNSDI